MVTNYDPEVAPNPASWLALDEHERIRLADAHHRAARIRLPSVESHAQLHVLVENQIAEGLDCVVRAMARLMSDGLSRHDALHAIGSVSKNGGSDMVLDVVSGHAEFKAAFRGQPFTPAQWQRNNWYVRRAQSYAHR